MRRLVTLICLALLAPSALPAQDPRWSGTLGLGYSQGVGDAFGGKGAFSANAAGFRALSPSLAVGVELGYFRFSALTTTLPHLYGPGSLQREDFRRSLWQATASMRVRATGGPWRPYGGMGLGAHLVRVHDHIVTRDASGAEISGLQFDQSLSEVKPGLHLLVGLQRPRILGRAGLGIQGRWDGVVSEGLASVLSVGVVMTLE